MKLPQRKSPRLPGYDYAQPGSYFVTICTHRMQHYFGIIHGTQMILSIEGHIATACWLAIPVHFSGVGLEESVIMPNHMHGIVRLSPDTLSGQPPTTTLSTVINHYKAAVTKHARQILGTPAWDRLWHTRFYDHIIRDEQDFRRIQDYILNNPARWAKDRFSGNTESGEPPPQASL
jgi:putative transposase